MKRLISLLLLLVILFFVIQLGITFFTKEHETKYKIYNGKKEFNITEDYNKENNNTYSLKIQINNKEFYYSIDNTFNKQKKIVKNIEYFENDYDICIFPILLDDNTTYIECDREGKLYTEFSYQDKAFINSIKEELKKKGIKFNTTNDTETKEAFGKTTIYTNNLSDTDIITNWQYKGIDIISKEKSEKITTLTFDKYENKLGHVLGKYYVVPNYSNSKILEFSSVSLIDLVTHKVSNLELGYTLSSSTYLNGIVDNKLYYTDPSNLIQIEININNKNVRLIGSSEIQAQSYDGTWKSINIYDFKSKEILFKNLTLVKDYQYADVKVGGSSHYFYTNDGNVYQISKKFKSKPVLLFNAKNLNNFNVVGDDVYYVVANTLYHFNLKKGTLPILEDNDLIYNYNNRINIYRNN